MLQYCFSRRFSNFPGSNLTLHTARLLILFFFILCAAQYRGDGFWTAWAKHNAQCIFAENNAFHNNLKTISELYLCIFFFKYCRYNVLLVLKAFFFRGIVQSDNDYFDCYAYRFNIQRTNHRRRPPGEFFVATANVPVAPVVPALQPLIWPCTRDDRRQFNCKKKKRNVSKKSPPPAEFHRYAPCKSVCVCSSTICFTIAHTPARISSCTRIVFSA